MGERVAKWFRLAKGRALKNSEPLFLQTTDDRGRGLRVTFVWNQDRYSHTVAIVQGERLLPLLASDECGDDPGWPLAPPLQQLSIEPRADGCHVALGVGMAGRSHWSISVEPIAGEPGFLFDIACRTVARPAFLGTRYRSQVPAMVAPDHASAELEISGTRVRVRAVAIAQQPPTLIGETVDGFAVEPQCAIPLTAPTVRWQYELRLS